MQVHLWPTDKIVELEAEEGGVIPARIWEGHTEIGIEVHAYISRIATDDPRHMEALGKELQEVEPPTPKVAAIPGRLVL